MNEKGETPFQELCSLCENLASISSRNLKVELVAKFLRKLVSGSEVSAAIRLMLGSPFTETPLNLGYSQLLKVFMETAGISEKQFLEEFNKTGDLGETIKQILEKRKLGVQQALTALGRPTIRQVEESLREAASITGHGSTSRKMRFLENYLRRLTPLEAKYFAKNLIGEMRHGFSEGLMEEALAKAFQTSVETVRLAHMALGELGRVGKILRDEGVKSLQQFTIQPFTPMKPMLAEPAQTLKEALEEHGGRSLLEYKLDGARVHVHKAGSKIKIFSRRLTEVTRSLPEIVKLARESFKGDEFILDGEVVAVDSAGRILPFQDVMKRYRRIIGVEELLAKIPTKICLFDVLYLNGEPLIRKPLAERRQLLEKIVPPEFLIPQVEALSLEEAEAFFSKALDEGCEGVMAKRPTSLYTPGRRGKHWLKIKRPPEVLDLVIVAAEYGYGYRYRWLSDYYLAVVDGGSTNIAQAGSLPDYIEALHGGKYRIVGKTFKGLTNQEIEDLTARLKRLAIETVGRTVIVKPEIVVEIGFSDIQPSPQYSCGYALRFARILRIRDDKRPEEADSLDTVRRLYEAASKKLDSLKPSKKLDT